jgi:hypothetical protein
MVGGRRGIITFSNLRVFFELLLGSSSATDAAAAAIFPDCQNWPVIPLKSGGTKESRGEI